MNQTGLPAELAHLLRIMNARSGERFGTAPRQAPSPQQVSATTDDRDSALANDPTPATADADADIAAQLGDLEIGDATPDNGAPLRLELSQISDRVKFLIPCIVLILLKLFLDHAVTFVLVVSCGIYLQSMRAAFDLQIALKERSSSIDMLLLLVRNGMLLLSVVLLIELTEYKHEVFNRLLFVIPNEHDKSIGLFSIIWCCLIADTILQSIVLLFKTLMMLSITGFWYMLRHINHSNNSNSNSSRQRFCSSSSCFTSCCCAKRRSRGSAMRTSREDEDDIEASALPSSNRSHNISSRQPLMTTVHSNRSSSGSSGSGDGSNQSPWYASLSWMNLANSVLGESPSYLNHHSTADAATAAAGSSSVSARQSTTGSTASRRSSTASAGTSATGSSSSSSSSTFVNDITAVADNSNSSSSSSSESSDASLTAAADAGGEYLFKLRICTLLDICALVIRTIVPFPLWAHFFSSGSGIAAVLKFFYVGFKFIDFTRKVHGCFLAIEFFICNKIDYGHYTTVAEMSSQRSSNNSSGSSSSSAAAVTVPTDWDYDCPVCFDRPNKPVTLACAHIFCETCIAEWLDKEKTCPVCRAEVHCSSGLLGAVKKDAVDPFPIII